MKPSGLNSIEWILNLALGLWKIAGWVVLIVVTGPVLYLIWCWDATTYQALALRALAQAPATRVTLDFNQTLWVPNQTQQLILFGVKASVDGVKPKDTPAWLRHWLPWAPGLGGGASFEGGSLFLDRYRRPQDVPQTDPWYFHGLMKLAPTRHWDDRTGVDYAFGKTTCNYLAYVGAVRAVLTMRYLVAGMAVGTSTDRIESAGWDDLEPQLGDPPAAYQAVGRGQPQPFLHGYTTDFGGKLPVVTLQLQSFDLPTWDSLPDLHYLREYRRNKWDNHMSWWGGPGAGNGCPPDNSEDLFITGVDGVRPQFTPLDFLLYHMPSTTSAQDQALDPLRQLTTDAFWDPLLPNDPARHAAHRLLGKLRQDLEDDQKFARRYSYILFSGDAFGRDPSIMKE